MQFLCILFFMTKQIKSHIKRFLIGTDGANYWFQNLENKPQQSWVMMLHINIDSKKVLLLSCILYPVSCIMYPVPCFLYT